MRSFFDATHRHDGRYALLIKFLNYGEMPNEEEPNHRQKRLISFEQDAPEIYASFLQLYNIDLLETDVHWYRFNVLLASLLRVDNNPLSAKLRLRTLDTGRLKGRDKHRAEAAKQSVAIQERISREDQRLEQQLIEAIQNGGNITEILQQRT